MALRTISNGVLSLLMIRYVLMFTARRASLSDAYIQWDPTESRPRKIGILAGTFEDGSLSIFIVPDPEDLDRKDHCPAYGKKNFHPSA